MASASANGAMEQEIPLLLPNIYEGTSSTFKWFSSFVLPSFKALQVVV